jgi:hypothetical protein
MNILIYFNLLDKPENMGISHLTSDLNTFLQERDYILKDVEILQDRFNFTKADGTIGYALIFNVDSDFQN